MRLSKHSYTRVGIDSAVTVDYKQCHSRSNKLVMLLLPGQIKDNLKLKLYNALYGTDKAIHN
jgi:hypothetical protein